MFNVNGEIRVVGITVLHGRFRGYRCHVADFQVKSAILILPTWAQVVTNSAYRTSRSSSNLDSVPGPDSASVDLISLATAFDQNRNCIARLGSTPNMTILWDANSSAFIHHFPGHCSGPVGNHGTLTDNGSW